MKLFIPKNLLSSASMTSTELLRRDDVKTRPFPSKIHGQMTDSSRIPLIVDFDCYINTAILLMLSIDVNSSLPDDGMQGNPSAHRFI